MIGRIIEEEGQKVIQTLAGATAGTVCKVNYGSDSNYAIPITLNEAGEGYVGISCACPGPFYNPATGTLTVDNICSTSSNAECADKVLSNSLSGDTVYNLAIWCATSDGNYNSMGFSGGRSITYNPYTATLNACCGNFTNNVSTNSMYVDNTMSFNAVSGTAFEINTGSECETAGGIDGNGMLSWGCGTCFADSCITNLTVTNKINGSICKADGTNCYNQYCLDYMSAAVDRPLLMTDVSDASNTQIVGTIGRATNCKLTFNPDTGYLKILNSNGSFGGVVYANKLCVGTGGITTCYDVVGYNDETLPQRTWYIYCNGEAQFCDCVGVCGCIQANYMYIMCNGDECAVISEANIGNYLTCQCRVSLETYLACTSLCSNVLYLVY